MAVLPQVNPPPINEIVASGGDKNIMATLKARLIEVFRDKVAAVSISNDADGFPIDIYIMVEDHTKEVYNMLIPTEDIIYNEFPKAPLEFHVRAYQDRDPLSAVPEGTLQIYPLSK